MPTKVEEKLRREAEEKFPGDKERQDRYIYGAMRHMGWKPEREKSFREQALQRAQLEGGS